MPEAPSSYALAFPMTCTIVGPGLVGTYLGIAAGATRCQGRKGAAPDLLHADLPNGRRSWNPVPAGHHAGPVLVSTRVDETPWDDLPADALAAQNGLGQPRAVVVCFMAVDRDGDRVRHLGPTPRLVLADPGPAWAPTLAAWRNAGLTVEVVADVRPAQWEKAILNATVGPICLATGLGMAAVWADRDLRALVLRATAEGETLARAAGVSIADGLRRRAETFFAAVGGHRPSILDHPSELGAILDPLLATARRHGVATPNLLRIADLVAAAGRSAAAEA